MDKNQMSQAFDYHKMAGIPILNLDSKNSFHKKKFSKKINKKLYSNYIKNNIASDGKNLGYKKILDTITDRFF